MRLIQGHPEAWRRNLTTAEPGVPWVTYYQPDSGARVELSRATFDNWVAKAAGLLADECDVEAGSTVLLDLEPHWLLPVWAWASWSLGAKVTLPDTDGEKEQNPVDVWITDDPSHADPTHADPSYRSGSATVVLSSRHPLGLPASQPAAQSTTQPGSAPYPSGVVDALADIRAYPDVRADPIPPADQPLIMEGLQELAVGPDLTELLQSTPVQRAGLLRSRPTDARALAGALLGPAFHSGSLVIVDGGTGADVERIRAQERADADFG